MSTIREVRFRPGVNEELVGMLERLLEEAKCGDLVGGAFAAPHRDGSVVTHFVSTENRLLEIAAVSRLLHRLHISADAGMS